MVLCICDKDNDSRGSSSTTTIHIYHIGYLFPFYSRRLCVADIVVVVVIAVVAIVAVVIVILAVGDFELICKLNLRIHQ